MTRLLTIRRPTAREVQLLEAFLEEEHPLQLKRRAEAILYYGLGFDGATIAKALRAHPNTIYADLQAFAREGLACLRPLSVGGARPRITPQQLAQLWEWAECLPRDFGLLDARWTLASFRDFVVKRQHLLKRISLEHLRRLLKKQDPQRPAILARIRRVFQHLPPNGVMVFFDVKPVTVKAYGGRRWSSHRLVLRKYQKTRGRFYLFALYDVPSGRVRWRYYHGKDSIAVCRFMRQVRRWYPDCEVWVVLDQDSAHPRKSKETRRVMRELKLHWISLPKASPDDNPCETIFSDVQQNVQDNSDDPDEQMMRRRISHRLAKRNRHRDRFIEIPYLSDSHKG